MAKKAVLIGCNYPETKAELKGCINDVWRMHKCLIQRYGFSENDITILIDTDTSHTQPTGKNIRSALSTLVGSASSGDVLFVHYSGHGTRLPAETGDGDDTGYDECIVPCDMNLITVFVDELTDDDFEDLINKVPEGCVITIVSDSCHSGGLIEGAKEQIGESTQGEGNDSGSGFKNFLHNVVHHDEKDDEGERGLEIAREKYDYVKNKSLPLSTLVDILKQKTGKDDIDVGKLRPTLFDMFGDDASPKVKKFMKFFFDKLNDGEGTGGQGGFLGMVGGLAQDFLKHKMNENSEYAKPAMETQVGRKQEVYAGSSKRRFPSGGILISGCQSNQTSADASPPGNASQAYGALSNAIQQILAETSGSVTNHDLVEKARRKLKHQGFPQQPGLYCNDRNAELPFVC